jgi:hypothetical protein
MEPNFPHLHLSMSGASAPTLPKVSRNVDAG